MEVFSGVAANSAEEYAVNDQVVRLFEVTSNGSGDSTFTLFHFCRLNFIPVDTFIHLR